MQRCSVSTAMGTLVVLILAHAAPAQVADSQADFSGTQGQAGWINGYHNVTANGAYDASDFIEFGPGGDAGFAYDGTKWDWTGGNPPWTEVSATGGHPNGTNNAGSGGEQWAMRRWTSDISGAANIELHLSKSNTGGGNGTIHRLFVNGEERSSMGVLFNDGVGHTWTVHVPELHVGDQVDFALDANGADGSDGSNFSGKVFHVSPIPTALVADSIADFSGTQGQAGWYNGYHNLTANGAYDATPGGTDDFIEFGPGGDAGFTFNGSAWDWGSGNPPWTFLDDDGGHPNGSNNAGSGGEQWTIRRWESDVDGDLFVEAFLAAENLGGGTGTTAHVFHNGDEVGSLSVGGTDGIGLTDVFEISDVQVGDFIDIALDATGPTGDTADGSDGSLFSAQIFQVQVVPEPTSLALWGMLGLALVGWPLAGRLRCKK